MYMYLITAVHHRCPTHLTTFVHLKLQTGPLLSLCKICALQGKSEPVNQVNIQHTRKQTTGYKRNNRNLPLPPGATRSTVFLCGSLGIISGSVFSMSFSKLGAAAGTPGWVKHSVQIYIFLHILLAVQSEQYLHLLTCFLWWFRIHKPCQLDLWLHTFVCGYLFCRTFCRSSWLWFTLCDNRFSFWEHQLVHFPLRCKSTAEPLDPLFHWNYKEVRCRSQTEPR